MTADKMLVPGPEGLSVKKKIKSLCNSFPAGLMKKPHLILLQKFTEALTSAQQN